MDGGNLRVNKIGHEMLVTVWKGTQVRRIFDNLSLLPLANHEIN
jgi:hypothetical protein